MPQRTFELVPTSLARAPGTVKAMTSKEAKKAYQQRNKGPKISRAQQRKQEQAELELQRRERERERASAKAKAVREKKAMKLEEEKRERKKMGLPEPSRFVRASQPTISLFVKGPGGKRTWEGAGDDGNAPPKRISVEPESEESISDGTVFGDDEPLPRLGSVEKLATTDEDSIDIEGTLLEEGLTGCNKFDEAIVQEVARDTKEDDVKSSQKTSQAMCNDSEDEFGDFVLSQSDMPELLEKLDSPGQAMTPGIPIYRQNSVARVNYDEGPLPDDDDDGLVTTQLLSEAAEADERISDLVSPAVRASAHISAISAPKEILEPQRREIAVLDSHSSPPPDNSSDATTHINTPNSLKRKSAKKETRRAPSYQMPPPSFIPKPSNTSLCQKSLAEQEQMVLNDSDSSRPPTSTQAFLEDNMDDFFPSRSQEVRELLNEVDDLPSDTQVTKELKASAFDDDDMFAGMFSTQDVTLSPQDLIEINTPSRPPPRPYLPVRHPPNHSHNRKLPYASHTTRQSSVTRHSPFIYNDPIAKIVPSPPFQSTKALTIKKQQALTGQENIRNEKTLPQISGSSQLPIDCVTIGVPIVAAKLEEPNKNEQTKHKEVTKAQVEVSQPAKRQRRMFEEKEEDLMHAAIHESKLEADKLKRTPAKSVPIKPRALKRVQSVASDYGDGDLNEQDWLALC